MAHTTITTAATVVILDFIAPQAPIMDTRPLENPGGKVETLATLEEPILVEMSILDTTALETNTATTTVIHLTTATGIQRSQETKVVIFTKTEETAGPRSNKAMQLLYINCRQPSELK